MYSIDNLLLDHVELPYLFDLAVHLVKLVGWVVKGEHSMTLLDCIIVTPPVPWNWVWGLGIGD